MSVKQRKCVGELVLPLELNMSLLLCVPLGSREDGLCLLPENRRAKVKSLDVYCPKPQASWYSYQAHLTKHMDTNLLLFMVPDLHHH